MAYSEENEYAEWEYLLITNTDKEKYPVCICMEEHTTGFHIFIGVKKFFLPTIDKANENSYNGYNAFAKCKRGKNKEKNKTKNGA